MLKYYWKGLYGGGEALHVELIVGHESIYLEFIPGVYRDGGNPKAYYVSAGYRVLQFKGEEEWVFTDSNIIPDHMIKYVSDLVEEAKRILVKQGINLTVLEPSHEDKQLHKIVERLKK